MPAEIKFSLGTTDLEETKILCQEENLKLERQWRANLAGEQPTQLSHLQITALAGEFYKETVAARRDEPGPPAEIERSLREDAKLKRSPCRCRPVLPSVLPLRDESLRSRANLSAPDVPAPDLRHSAKPNRVTGPAPCSGFRILAAA